MAQHLLESLEHRSVRTFHELVNQNLTTFAASSTVGSFRSLATSLGLKKASKDLAVFPPILSGSADALLAQSRPYTSIPESSPGAKPQTDHFTVDPTLLFDPSSLTMDTVPIPGHVSRPGNPAPHNARLSLGLTPATPSKSKGPSTTLRLVSGANGPQAVSPDTFNTPKLKPFPTSFDLIMASPIEAPKFTSLSQGVNSVMNDDELSGPSSFTVNRESPVDPAGSRDSVTSQSPLTQRTEPFIFGSPLPQNQVSNTQFKAAAHTVLEEMNKRLASQGVNIISPDLLTGLNPDGSAKASSEHNALQCRPRKTSAIAQKFEKVHESHFSKMQSIAGHSVRAGVKRKASAVEQAPGPDRRSTSRPSASNVKFPEDASDRRQSKRPRVSINPSANLDQDEVKRQEATKRKLEQNKARRRSSVGVSGRVSVGRGTYSSSSYLSSLTQSKAQTQAKPGRFGFISTAAKTIVSSVWGRGKPLSKSTLTKPAPVPAPRSQPPKASTRIPSTNVNGNGASFGTSKSSLPPNRSQGNTGPSLRVPSVGSTNSKTMGHLVTSMGARSKIALPSEQAAGTTASRRTQTSSRLLAPTASSLAKATAVSSIRARIPSVDSTEILGQVTNTNPPDEGTFLPNSEPAKRVSIAPKPTRPPTVVQRSLSGRRPRISRGKVIAKLASQRTASGGVNGLVSPRVRSSLGAKQRRSMAGKARPSGGPSGPASSANLKKRARQSEISRRRPRVTIGLAAAA